MIDANWWEPSLYVSVDPICSDPMSLAASLEGVQPATAHLVSERTQLRAVPGHSVITEMPIDDATQISTLLWNWVVHAFPQLEANFTQLRLHSFPHRLPLQDMPATSALPTDVGKPEEVEGAWLLSSTRAPSRPDPRPERDGTCFVGMELQTERCEPVA